MSFSAKTRKGSSLDRRAFLLGLTGLGAVPLFLSGCGSRSGTLGTVPTPTPTPTVLPYSGTLQRTDAQMRAVIERFLAFNSPPLNTLTPQQARQQPTIADAVRAVLQSQGRSTSPEPVASVRDTQIPGPGGPLPIRVYTPAGTGPFPVTVYFHGGGWVIATIDTYDSSCRALANAAQSVVISVEYRKGPENRFPAAHEDAYAATQYLIQNAATFNGDPARVAVAGESAGGNMAAAVCLLARDHGGSMPVSQLLVYPVADTDTNTESYQENADAVPLNRPNVLYFLENYLRGIADRDDPLISLVRVARVTSDLPPATVITAEIDPLRTEGQRYSERLQAAGVPVRYRNYDGVTHEFFGTGAVVDKAKDAVAFAAQGLTDAFAR